MEQRSLIPVTVHERALMVREALALQTVNAGREAEVALELVADKAGDSAALMVIRELNPLEWGLMICGRAGLPSLTAELLEPAQIVAMLRAQFLLIQTAELPSDALGVQKDAEQLLVTLLMFADAGDSPALQRRQAVLDAIAGNSHATLYAALPFLGAPMDPEGNIRDDTLAALASVIRRQHNWLWEEIVRHMEEFGPLSADDEEAETQDGFVSLETIEDNHNCGEDFKRDQQSAADTIGELVASALERAEGEGDRDVIEFTQNTMVGDEQPPVRPMTEHEQMEAFVALIAQAREEISQEAKRTSARRAADTAKVAVGDMFRPLE
ncbi:MAG: hypothetical protein HY006_00775 [Candidatus Sungbacteria bacterium]|nr:hypothetical protein [Candidatus Sungbacteria bacterium]